MLFNLLISIYNPIIDVQAQESVKEGNNENITVVKDMELEDYQTEMVVGEEENLTVTLIPSDATDQTITFKSRNVSVATIDERGKIIAKNTGDTVITAESGNVVKEFTLRVKEQTIYVRDIEISEFQEEMEVGKTQTITTTVLPSDATDQTVKYSSTNPKVATISNTGEIKAIAKGSTTIQITCGEVKKELNIKVKFPTTNIVVEETYMVLKIGSSYQIKARVTPKEANQKLTYYSTDNSVISVNQYGRVKALHVGKSSVVISNGDYKRAITFIVNEQGSASSKETEKETIDDSEEVLSASTNEMLEQIINATEENVIIESSGGTIITKEILKYLYENKKILTVKSEGYSIFIRGNDILNYHNELYTQILFQQNEDGTTFILNHNAPLPGRIHIEIQEDILSDGKYVYLYNPSKEKYEILNTKFEEGQIELDITGKYMITEKKISRFTFNILFIGIGLLALIGCILAYIIIKKKYWFW